MILDAMLSHSPVFLLAMSASLLAAFGVVRAWQAMLRLAQQRPHPWRPRQDLRP